MPSPLPFPLSLYLTLLAQRQCKLPPKNSTAHVKRLSQPPRHAYLWLSSKRTRNSWTSWRVPDRIIDLHLLLFSLSFQTVSNCDAPQVYTNVHFYFHSLEFLPAWGLIRDPEKFTCLNFQLKVEEFFSCFVIGFESISWTGKRSVSFLFLEESLLRMYLPSYSWLTIISYSK